MTRQEIIDAVRARLETIIAGESVSVPGEEPFIHPVTAKVRETDALPDDVEDLPVVLFMEGSCEVVTPGKDDQIKIHNLQMLCVCKVKEETEGQSGLRALMQSVVKAVTADRRLGGLLTKCRVTRNGLDRDERGQFLGTGTVEFLMQYQTTKEEI